MTAVKTYTNDRHLYIEEEKPQNYRKKYRKIHKFINS